MTTYGERLRAARKARGLSQRELGKRLGVTHVAAGDIEREKTDLSRKLAIRLGDILGVDPAWLMFGDPVPPRTVMARIGAQWCQVCGRRE